jgi:hypothetical protein
MPSDSTYNNWVLSEVAQLQEVTTSVIKNPELSVVAIAPHRTIMATTAPARSNAIELPYVTSIAEK